MKTQKHQPTQSAAERFKTYNEKALECAAEAAKWRAKGNQHNVEHFEFCAENYRKAASGFDHRASSKAFTSTERRVSLGLSRPALDALESFGIKKKDHASFLAGLLKEALFALEDIAYTKGERLGTGYRLTAEKTSKSRYREHYDQNLKTQAQIEFALACAEHSQLKADAC